MTVLYLVRHGQTPWQHERRYAGSTDIGLTDKGVAQAQSLARWAASAPDDGGPAAGAISAIVTSDLQRTVLTAEPVVAALGLEAPQDARLREIDFGQAEGLTRDEIRDRFGDVAKAHFEAPGVNPLPDGEPGFEAVARGLEALDEIAAAHSDPVLVVTHGTLIRLMLCRWLGIDLNRYREYFPTVHNTAITTVELADGAAAVLDFNVLPRA